MRQRKQGSSNREETEDENHDRARSKAREELAAELEALKALQTDVKSQLATLQGLVATKATSRKQQNLYCQKER
jgi:ribosomal protein L29